MQSAMSDSVPIMLKQLAQLWVDCKMSAEGSTTDYHRDVLSVSKPEAAHLSFGRELPIQVEFERWLARNIEYWRTRLHGQGRDIPGQDKTSEARKLQRAAILEERGDPTAVAYRYGLTTQGVRQLRTKHGLDPASGLPTRQLTDERIEGKQTYAKPLTAPPEETAKRLEECE